MCDVVTLQGGVLTFPKEKKEGKSKYCCGTTSGIQRLVL